MSQSGRKYTVERTKPFRSTIAGYKSHSKLLENDLPWIEEKLAVGPDKMGDHVPGLKGLNLPVFKARLKDSCCNLSAREGWRIYYAVSNKTLKVYMLFIHHKKEIENPGTAYLQQKIQAAFSEGV